MALSDTGQQVMWIESLFQELGFNMWQILICTDNQGSIFISSNPFQERRMKHINIHYHYIHKLIEDKKVSVFFIPGMENPVDMLTKNLAAEKFLKLQENLGIIFNHK